MRIIFFLIYGIFDNCLSPIEKSPLNRTNALNSGLHEFILYLTIAITSISTFTSFGSRATSTAERAGLCSPK